MLIDRTASMEMKKVIKYIAFILSFITASVCNGQKVFVTSVKYHADFVIYVTDNKWEADHRIYITDNRFEAGWPCDEIGETLCGRWFMTDNKYQADIQVYFTSNKYQADRIIWYTNNKFEASFEI